jgi:hypothetical protein
VLFKEADKEKTGKLDEKAVAAAVNLLFSPQPAFGPPGARREEPKKADKKR